MSSSAPDNGAGRSMQHALLEGAIWDELFAARACPHTHTHTDAHTDTNTGEKPEEPALTAPAMARILRRVDRVVGVTSQATSAASSYASPALQLGGIIGRAEVERRYADLVHDRRVLRELLRSPGIEQRTPAWYAAREGLVTASDFAQALGMGKFASQRDFFVKKVEMPPFTAGNAPALRWGVMFEPVAGELYSARSGGVRVHEFGLLRHPSVPHLGASPDGISDAGVMLEIKCPFMRRINREVPFQYYCQIQGQLAVCGLRRCDYLECEFEEYADESEFARDSVGNSDNPDDDGAAVCRDRHLGYSAETGREKGVIAEFSPPPTPPTPPSSGSAPAPTPAPAPAPPSYAYSPLPFAYDTGEQYERALRAWMEEQQQQRSPPPTYRFWRLKTYSVLRVEADDDMTRDMLRDLEGVWRRVLAYRQDRDAYEREVLQRKAPPASSPPPPPPSSSVCTSASPAGDDGVCGVSLPPSSTTSTESWWSTTMPFPSSARSYGNASRGRGRQQPQRNTTTAATGERGGGGACSSSLARGEYAFLDDE